MSGRVYLVDGSGYIFRAFYAVHPLTTKQGFPTNALFGFIKMLRRLLKESDSDHVVAIFDAGRETFRLEMFPEYKANRAECPAELLQQMPYFRQISYALGLTVIDLPGYEADDIIGTLATRLAKEGREVVIVSGDKDLMQLVNPQVCMWDTLNDKHYGAAEVKEKMGVAPEKIAELLALTGDSSDNVPGLAGVGPKTAVQLIEKFGDVEAVIAAVDKLKADSSIRNRNKIAEQIESSAETLRLSRKLVEVHTHAPVKIEVNGEQMSAEALDAEVLYEALRRSPPRQDLLQDLLTRFEFDSLLAELNLQNAARTVSSLFDETPRGAKYTNISPEEFPAWLTQFAAQKEFSFDLETTSLNVLEAKIVGASFCWSDTEAFYLPFAHTQATPQIAVDTFLSTTAAIFSNSQIKKCGQNLKYDIEVLARHGVPVRGLSFDSMLAAYLLKPDRGSYNLTTLANHYLELPVIEFDEVLGEVSDFSQVEIQRATRYACQDAHYVWLLKHILLDQLSSLGLTQVFTEIEMPLVSVLAQMELAGVQIDTDLLARMSDQFGAELEILKGKIFELAGGEFNINSPKQLSEVLFEKLGLSTQGVKRTKTGISTDSSVLEKLADQHPLPAQILQHRFLFKLKSTFIDALAGQVSSITGRLHSRFNQTVTGTGRLSSSDPNLQNIPIQTPEGRKIRAAFVAPPGKLLISADYSQIELRLLAHLSGDEKLIGAFRDNVDIHARTARQLLGLRDSDEVSPEQRRIGKTINFGIIYGMGPFRLARDLGISFADANRYIEQYFGLFSGVKEYFSNLEREAEEKGYVSTLCGRKRFLADIDASGRDKGFVLRAALNAPLQGSAADVIKSAMCRLDERITREQFPLRMILQIHDELLFECEEQRTEESMELVRSEMEQVMDLAVPLKVDVGFGRNWQEAH